MLLLKRESLPRWRSASRSKDGMSPSSLGESYSIFIFVLFPAVFLLLLDVKAFEADRFARLNISLIQLCDKGVPALAIVVSCMTERWRTAATNVDAQSLISSMLCGAIRTVGNGWIVGMTDRIMAHSETNITLPNGLSCSSFLWLHFQSFSRNITPRKVYLCDVHPSEYSSRPVSCNSTG